MSTSPTRPVLFAIVLGLCAVLTACTAPPAPAEPAEAEPEYCSEFVALTSDERDAIYEGREFEVYTPEGIETVREDALYDTGCVGHESEEYLLINPLLEGQEPDCAIFAGATPEVQGEWWDKLVAEEHWGLSELPDSAAFVQACRDFGSDNMVRISNYLVDFPAYVAWTTESRLGYTTSGVLGVGTPQTGDELAPENDYVPGAACGFDPSTDAAIQLSLHLTNTTSEQSNSLGAAIALQRSGSPSTTAFLEANFSTGPQCSGSAGSGAAELHLTFTEPAGPGGEANSTLWVIVKNYFSPRYPDGARDELTSYRVVITPPQMQDDPILEFTPASIGLDGVR